jgi:hypothetical protein
MGVGTVVARHGVALSLAGLLLAGCAGTPHGVVISQHTLKDAARGIATCTTLGISAPAELPTSTSPHITATAKQGITVKEVVLVERYSPARCASAQYVTPNRTHGRLTAIIEFPVQLAPRAREALATGEVAYLHRTGAFLSVRYHGIP